MVLLLKPKDASETDERTDTTPRHGKRTRHDKRRNTVRELTLRRRKQRPSQHTSHQVCPSRSTTSTHPGFLRRESERLLTRLLVSHGLLGLLEGSSFQLEFVHLARQRSIARIAVVRARLRLLLRAINLLIFFVLLFGPGLFFRWLLLLRPGLLCLCSFLC
jgi:hypothetical protein